MGNEDYLGVIGSLPVSFHQRYVHPPLDLPPAQSPNVIIPDTGAAKYWYVNPNAQGVPTPQQNFQSPLPNNLTYRPAAVRGIDFAQNQIPPVPQIPIQTAQFNF